MLEYVQVFEITKIYLLIVMNVY